MKFMNRIRVRDIPATGKEVEKRHQKKHNTVAKAIWVEIWRISGDVETS